MWYNIGLLLYTRPCAYLTVCYADDAIYNDNRHGFQYRFYAAAADIVLSTHYTHIIEISLSRVLKTARRQNEHREVRPTVFHIINEAAQKLINILIGLSISNKYTSNKSFFFFWNSIYSNSPPKNFVLRSPVLIRTITSFSWSSIAHNNVAFTVITLIQTHTLRFNGHFSRWTSLSRLTLNSPSLSIPKTAHPFGTDLNFPCHS